MSVKLLKLVVVGDGAVGKTSLLVSYKDNIFLSEHIPTIFEAFSANIVIADQQFCLTLYDTAGQEEYDKLRPLSYPSTNAFLVCFSIIHPPSYYNVRDKWYPEVNHFCPTAKKILVGTKLDLKDDPQKLEELRKGRQVPVSKQMGLQLMNQIGAEKYIECSARTGEGVKDVFDEAILSCIKPDTKRKKCVLL